MEDQENNNTINNGVNRKQCYRNLLNQVEEIHESSDVSLQTVRRIKNILSEANLLNDQSHIKEKIACPEEILLDSLVLSSASDALVKCTKALDVLTANYEPLEFASKIVEAIKTDEDVEQTDFIKLLQDARDIISNTLEFSFLYGTYDLSRLPEPKEKKQVVKERQEQSAKKELIQVQNTQNDEETNEDTMIFLLKVLQHEYKENNEMPLKYYDFVIDTNSFSTTVENIFYFSFLIRDGKASLELDEAGVPIIRPTSKKDLKSFRQNNGVNIQTITSIDMAEWNRFKAREGHIQKHRRSK